MKTINSFLFLAFIFSQISSQHCATMFTRSDTDFFRGAGAQKSSPVPIPTGRDRQGLATHVPSAKQVLHQLKKRGTLSLPNDSTSSSTESPTMDNGGIFPFSPERETHVSTN